MAAQDCTMVEAREAQFVASEDESGPSIPGSPSSASSSDEENGRRELGRGEQVALSKLHGIRHLRMPELRKLVNWMLRIARQAPTSENTESITKGGREGH